MTPSLPRKCSTTELHRQKRAGDETRTRDPDLGRVVLYQLSYSRIKIPSSKFKIPCSKKIKILIILFLTSGSLYPVLFVGRAGFEPTKAYASRFTVCPSWPLWYLPIYFQYKKRADGGIRTPDQLITNQLLWPTELHRQF